MDDLLGEGFLLFVFLVHFVVYSINCYSSFFMLLSIIYIFLRKHTATFVPWRKQDLLVAHIFHFEQGCHLCIEKSFIVQILEQL